MQELVKIQVKWFGEKKVNAVDARELHQFLGVGRDFSNWIKQRIEKYNFKENRDFAILLAKSGEQHGGQNRIDYALSLNMAKELCMVENNEMGKQAREYFIECEERAKSIEVKPLSRVEILHMAYLESMKIIEEKDAEIEQEKLEHRKTGMKLLHTEQIVKAQKPKVEFAETVAKSESEVSLTHAIKHLGITKPNKMIEVLRTGIADGDYNASFKWLENRGGKNYPMQKAIDKGWLVSRLIVTENEMAFPQTLVTMAGLQKLSNLIQKYGIPEEAQ